MTTLDPGQHDVENRSDDDRSAPFGRSAGVEGLPRRTRRTILFGPGALSRTPPGLRVRVDKILFDRPRERCEAEDIRPGTVLRCMAWLPGAVLVELPGGDTAQLDTDLAEFVSVSPVDSSDGGPDSRGRAGARGPAGSARDAGPSER